MSESEWFTKNPIGPTLTEDEVARYQKLLKRIKHGRTIPSEFKEGVIFDGTVVQSLPNDSGGHRYWLIKPDVFYQGKDQIHDELVKVVSSTPGMYGGATLELGHKYRVLAIDFLHFGEESSVPFCIWRGSVLELKASKIPLTGFQRRHKSD
jgi:hypothetical protein